jgi:hypothetical protein
MGLRWLLCYGGPPASTGLRPDVTATRFVVDHAPCPVLLLWPDEAPGVESIPPPAPALGPPTPSPSAPALAPILASGGITLCMVW